MKELRQVITVWLLDTLAVDRGHKATSPMCFVVNTPDTSWGNSDVYDTWPSLLRTCFACQNLVIISRLVRAFRIPRTAC